MQMPVRALTLTVLLVLTTACGGGSSDGSATLEATRVIRSWALTSLQQDYVIRSEAEWQAAWLEHRPTSDAGAEPPPVDFSRSMVLGVVRGSGPSGCHQVAIRRVLEDADQIQVQYTHSESPPPGALCTTAFVSLTDFVVVALRTKPVTFLRVPA